MSDLKSGYLFVPSEGRDQLTSMKLNAQLNGATINPSFVAGKPAVSSVTSSDQLLLLKADGTYARVPATAVGTGGGGGGGDMYKATYDTNNNGVVDTCDSLAYSKLTGVPASFTPSAHETTHITGGSDVIPAPTTSKSGLVPILPTSGTGSIAFVQKANSGAPSGTATSKTATFGSAQTLNNTNIVVIQYGNATGLTISQTVSSVTDSAGNVYTASPIGFITMNSIIGGNFAQGCAVYYCSNIAAYGVGNVVTVTISGAASFFAISILEYSGLATSSAIDVSASATANSGASATANSGTATTTNANDLLLGVFSLFDGPSSVGSGYTSRDSFYTCLVEEQLVTSTGSYNATAISAGTSGWTAQMLAFKAGGAGGAGGSDPSKFLRGDATWNHPDWSNLTGVPASFVPSAHASTHLDNGTDPVPVATTARTGSLRALSGSATQYLDGSGNWSTPAGTGPTVDPGVWTALTPASGWSVGTVSPQYRLETLGTVKSVYCRGIVQGAWAAIGTTAFTFPSAAFPSAIRSQILSGYQNTGTASDVSSYVATVSTAGVVVIYFLAASNFVWADHSQTQVIYLDGLIFSI